MIAFIQRYAMAGMGIVIALCLAALVERQFELMGERTARANEQAAFSKSRAEMAERAEAAEAKQRRIENELRAKADIEKGKLDASLAENARLAGLLADARRDTGRLRDQLSQFADGGGAGSDSLAACRARAAALAAATSRGVELLETIRFRDRQLLRELAKERDDFAAEVTACVQAWPVTPAGPQP
jgi:hypothetical protein